MSSSRGWIVVTGGGSGIGRALVKYFSEQYNILTCGRRSSLLEETKAQARRPERVVTVPADISDQSDRERFVSSLPPGAGVVLLVQNAAIGDPARLTEVSLPHLELALRVNLVAPLALTQALLPALRLGAGRILHLGTSVAHHPQEGSLTYGITKGRRHYIHLGKSQDISLIIVLAEAIKMSLSLRWLSTVSTSRSMQSRVLGLSVGLSPLAWWTLLE